MSQYLKLLIAALINLIIGFGGLNIYDYINKPEKKISLNEPEEKEKTNNINEKDTFCLNSLNNQLNKYGNIEFEFNSSEISGKNNFNNLSKIANVLVKQKEINIIINGYTDSDGQKQYNIELSEKRAIAVKNLLVKYGIAEDRISTIGHGDNDPIATNDTPENKKRNRRIEYVLIDTKK